MDLVHAVDGAEDRWLTVGEAARTIGVSADTIRRWTDKGLLPSRRTPSNQRRIRLSDAQAAITDPNSGPADTPAEPS